MWCILIQLQAECQAESGRDEIDSSTQREADSAPGAGGDHDDIDAALNDLQVSLEGSTAHNTGDITHVPELQEYLKHFK